jgi:hypothetical protein
MAVVLKICTQASPAPMPNAAERAHDQSQQDKQRDFHDVFPPIRNQALWLVGAGRGVVQRGRVKET